MMMASRRASAIRAFRRVDRRAIADAHSFSLSAPLQRVSMTFAASYSRVRTRRSPHLEMNNNRAAAAETFKDVIEIHRLV